MSTEQAVVVAPVVTTEQLDLIKRTVANGATADELKLYLFDCARQGVHPLDKLLHFTKRQGKYTPITSIDFMRIRAADTGEYAGSDDALFADDGVWSSLPKGKQPSAASVTVYRLVQGQRCAFTATARWSEYKPEAGQTGRGDVMWLKMPHTMLAKCAEALALRKGFPRQLAGLYAKEEMDQAGPSSNGGYSVEAPADARKPEHAGDSTSAVVPSVQNGGASGHSNYATTQSVKPDPPSLPPGAVLIQRVDFSPTTNANVTKAFVVLSTGEQVTTIKKPLQRQLEQWCQDQTPVIVETKATKWGIELVSAHADTITAPLTDAELEVELAQQERATRAGEMF